MSPDQQRNIAEGCRFLISGDPLPQQPRLQKNFPVGASYGPLDAPDFIVAGGMGSSDWGVLQVNATRRGEDWL